MRVESSIVQVLTSISCACALLGCVEVDGGAVELSWKIRMVGEPDKSSCDLTEPDIARIRVCWAELGQTGGHVCDVVRSTDFSCTAEHGVTGFVIDDGRWQIWIEPVCPDGFPAESGKFDVPPPIVRDIERGQVATLNALLVVAEQDACLR